ncbi:MAG TPA: MoxR family ATPase [Planctomycetota bacterium]|nr:MoxR family ATPase [Planctomycetota bacterium]
MAASEPPEGVIPLAAEETDLEAVERLNAAYQTIRGELAKVIVGQGAVIEHLLIAIFARGHGLLVGVPGLAKTLMVSTLARALDLTFSRIQFTPDLMPSDITGTEVIMEDRSTGERSFRFLKGPVFANVILADEINRTPPKTQASLLEAMQERQVTAGGEKRLLPDPFFVLATQNPIEQEGTYPLPEAQLDRFMFEIIVDYPSEEEEYEILRVTTAPFGAQLSQVLSAQEIIDLQQLVLKVPISEHVIRYAMRLARSTRLGEPDAPEFIRRYVRWGAGPRAGQYMILGGKARAILNGRYYVSTEDIRAVAHPVLRHRIIKNFNAEAEGMTADKLVDRLLEAVPAPEHDLAEDPRLPGVLKEA